MNRARRSFCSGLPALLAFPSSAVSDVICAQTSLGETCREGFAHNVVSLDQQSTEYLLALGLQPVGAANPKSYRKFTNDAEPRLAETVVDLGLSSAPNIELIMALQPDLIVGNVFNVQKGLGMLKEIAPVAAFLSYPSNRPDQYQNLVATLDAVARLTGRQAEAARFLAAFEDDIAVAKERLSRAGRTSHAVVLGNVNAGVTGAEIMLFNGNALPAEILRRCGFNYALSDARFVEKGFTVTTVESLIALEFADFLYMPFNEKGVNSLMATPIWRNLQFVREGRFHAIPYRLIHNGPLSARLFLRDLQAALLT